MKKIIPTFIILLNYGKNFSSFGNSKKMKIVSNSGINNFQKYLPKSNNQLHYVEALNNKDIDLLFCLGPAGTGKTLFACKYGIENLKKTNKVVDTDNDSDNDHNNNHIIKKIIITRPTVSVEEELGFLPGNIQQKMYPWTLPIFDIFEKFYSKEMINQFITNNIIEIVPLGFMQGRTFEDTIIIADEMQNSTPSQMFMILTRLGKNSKMVITGDLMQTKNENNGLQSVINKLHIKYKEEELIKQKIKIISMKNTDIQRHPIVAIITDLYN
jgi:phosphate starvation-inducible PhoH-like protein